MNSTQPNLNCEACRHPLARADSICPECGCDVAGGQRVRRIRRMWRNDAILLLGVTVAASVWFGFQPAARSIASAAAWLNEPWPDYTAARLAYARSHGQAVVLFFDAEWVSVGCQRSSFYEVRNALPRRARELGVSPLRVDVTGANSAGISLLASFGVATVPAYVILDSQGGVASISDRPEVIAERLPALSLAVAK